MWVALSTVQTLEYCSPDTQPLCPRGEKRIRFRKGAVNWSPFRLHALPNPPRNQLVPSRALLLPAQHSRRAGEAKGEKGQLGDLPGGGPGQPAQVAPPWPGGTALLDSRLPLSAAVSKGRRAEPTSSMLSETRTDQVLPGLGTPAPVLSLMCGGEHVCVVWCV